MHRPEIALALMPMEIWELSFQMAIGLSPFDLLYDIGSLIMDRDVLTGQSLTDFDQAAILAGLLNFGLGDDVIKAGQKLAVVGGLRRRTFLEIQEIKHSSKYAEALGNKWK